MELRAYRQMRLALFDVGDERHLSLVGLSRSNPPTHEQDPKGGDEYGRLVSTASDRGSRLRTGVTTDHRLAITTKRTVMTRHHWLISREPDTVLADLKAKQMIPVCSISCSCYPRSRLGLGRRA
jgi:hypothetical protein